MQYLGISYEMKIISAHREPEVFFEYAKSAEEKGFKVMTTTLASSRWKSLEQINEAGRWATQQVEGVTFWEQNWRKGGLQERRNQLLKAHNFYNQLYCGCEFSLKSRINDVNLPCNN